MQGGGFMKVRLSHATSWARRVTGRPSVHFSHALFAMLPAASSDTIPWCADSPPCTSWPPSRNDMLGSSCR